LAQPAAGSAAALAGTDPRRLPGRTAARSIWRHVLHGMLGSAAVGLVSALAFRFGVVGSVLLWGWFGALGGVTDAAQAVVRERTTPDELWGLNRE
jgi:hypothetical protein